MLLLLSFLTAIISKISIPRPSNHLQNYPFLSIPTASTLVLALVLSHFYYLQVPPPRYLSSSSPSTQMVCNSDTWIFSNHYFYQGISPSGVLVGYYSIKELTRQASSASKSFFTSLILYFLAYLVPPSEKWNVISDLL